MKASPSYRTVATQLLMAALILTAAEGCRRKAKPAADVSGVEVEAQVAGQATDGAARPGSVVATPVVGAPITNGIAPPLPVDPKTGKIMFKTESGVVKGRSGVE